MKKHKNSSAKEIFYSKQYLSNYAKRFRQSAPYFKEHLIGIIELFIENSEDAILRGHALSGTMQGKRSFSVTPDIRIIYRETDEYIIFLDIGNHEQVYTR